MKKTPKRWRLVQDGDGHWYLIRSHELSLFGKWEAAGPYWEGYEGPSFHQFRIDGPQRLTFENPVEE